MKNILRIVSLAAIAILPGTVMAQLSFTNANNRLTNSNVRSGCAVTVVDVNGDGLDDIVRLHQGNIVYLELQTRTGTFTHHYLADIGGFSAWSMTMADVDKNGWRDVIADGDNGIHLVKIFENGGNITATDNVLNNSDFFLQNSTFCDINNDGWIDLFGCDDNDASKLFLNDGAGNLNLSTSVSFAANPGVSIGGDPADSGNYGSAWIDFDNDRDLDLFIAHCRQSTSNPTDLRRINRLFVNDGNNNFTEQGAAAGLDIGWQTWTATFGDIDNDGDLDVMFANHDHESQIFENNGLGVYTELTNTNFNTNTITPIEAVMEDFDNDGFVDILVAGDEWVYYKNNGDKTFTREYGLFADNGMLSFATGDLNHDGFIDIYASYGNPYQQPSNTYDDVLYLNNKNSNNFITFDLKGTTSNSGAIGARATIYGPWGIQIREVRAGESYGTCNSSMLHFGLGQTTVVDSAVIWFPSGTITTLTGLDANQFVTVVEGACIISGNIVPGPYVLCTGQSLNLTAPAGFASYLWSDGSTNQILNVTTAGTFNVMVTDNTGCSNISPTVSVLLNPDETPLVAVSGELVFCEGGTALLTSSPASSYLWSDGSTTQSITPGTSGNYVVTIQGTCSSFTSAPVSIQVLDAPEPVTQGATSPVPAALLLTATGNNLSWYDQQTGGTLLTTGPSYTTPMLNLSTIYWVEAMTQYPGDINYTGQIFHQGTQYSGGNGTNATLIFDVMNPATLVSVKVYTDIAGDREIQLRNSAGTVINSALVSIPVDTSRVTLNFSLVPGTDYELTTNPVVNNQTLGTTTPRLRRSSAGVTYPYEINNLVSINNSSQGTSFYYYFYDWEVQEPQYDCVSDRVPVNADITVGLNETGGIAGLNIFPNPASKQFQIHMDIKNSATFELHDLAGRLVKESKVDRFNETAAFEVDGIAKGTYSLTVITAEGKAVRKVVIN